MNITLPLIMDGAMGTQLMKKGMPLGVCPEKWILENPQTALDIQRAYVDAGSQVIYAPTFGANSLCLENHGILNMVNKYNLELVNISKKAAGGKAFVAGDISSAGSMLYPMGNMSFEDIYDVYAEQAAALETAGVDLFVIETMSSVPEARAALLAVKAVSTKPVFVTFSCNENGRTMMGTDICAALEIMQGMGANAFGINCSLGPEEIIKQIQRLYTESFIPIIAKPNAGLPMEIDGKTQYSVNSKIFASYIPKLIEAGAGIFGSCCGSDETFIAAIKETLSGAKVKMPAPKSEGMLPCATEKDAFLLDPSAAVEEIFACDDELEDNIYGLNEGELFGIEIESKKDVAAFSDIQYAIKNPLCIVCDDAELLEKTLRVYQGRALYDGSLNDDKLLPLVEKYGLII